MKLPLHPSHQLADTHPKAPGQGFDGAQVRIDPSVFDTGYNFSTQSALGREVMLRPFPCFSETCNFYPQGSANVFVAHRPMIAASGFLRVTEKSQAADSTKKDKKKISVGASWRWTIVLPPPITAPTSLPGQDHRPAN